MNQLWVKIGLLVAVIVGAVVLMANRLNRPIDQHWDFDAYHYICPTDGTTLTWTAQEFREFQRDHFGDDVMCPEDGTPMVRAEQCPHCRTIFAAQRQVVCPSCGRSLFEQPDQAP